MNLIEDMNFPENNDREYDADSDDTYCSDAEMNLTTGAREDAVEPLTLNCENNTSNFETKIDSIKGQESENEVMKLTCSQDFDEQSKSCMVIPRKSVRFQLKRRKDFRKTGLVKKSTRSIKKLQMLEHHRVKMKNHGKTLTNRIFAIRNDVKMWLGGYGSQINEKHCIALYEEVKAIRNILHQLYQASRRLTNYIGGELPFTYKRYSSANQICETLLLQLNPATYESSINLSKHLNKDGSTSSDEDDTDSEHGQSFNSEKKLPNYGNKTYVLPERGRSKHLNGNRIYFTKSVPDSQLLEENMIKAIEPGRKTVMQEKIQNLTTNQENGTCGVIMNFTSSLTLNENLTLSQANQYKNQEKIQCAAFENEYPKSNQLFPVVSDKMSTVDVEMIDLCEDDVSSSPELINMEVLKSHLNQVDDLRAVPTDCISKEESVSHDMPMNDIDNAKESSEPKESEDQCASSQTQTISSSIHRYEMNKTIQDGNIKHCNLKNHINKELEPNFLAFDEFPKDDVTEIESLASVNNLIDTKTSKISYKESESDETFQEGTKCSAFQNTVPKIKGMRNNKRDKTEENISNIDSISNDWLNVPSWCYIFEQHKIKNGLPTLIELMLAGMIHPGEKVLTIKDNDIKGSLLKNGKICTPEGATFQSPMSWCSAWSDGKSISKNLAYQRVHYKGVPLIEVCQKAFEMALEKLSATNLEKESCHMAAELVLETGCSATELENDFSESFAPEDFEEKESLEDSIFAIEAVMFHSLQEFKVDEALECFFSENGKLTGDLELIDEW
ncbi:hypothetical protein J437_LFUL013562 [Ladona fulva]|uniref:RAMA domain-containing protein n=1 Tax=Ladona fulva TaxID=123851 RepID=A0A8K0P537_LADFU|nr:hypothetical protein J437_LFUL013562 [Ladona fulva]